MANDDDILDVQEETPITEPTVEEAKPIEESKPVFENPAEVVAESMQEAKMEDLGRFKKEIWVNAPDIDFIGKLILESKLQVGEEYLYSKSDIDEILNNANSRMLNEKQVWRS